MSMIEGVNNSLLQSQLANIQLRQEIGTSIAKKTLDTARAEGDAVLSLLAEAVDFARQVNSSSRPILTVGAVVSGLGQNLDVSA